MGKYHIETEKVGGTFTNPAIKATAWCDGKVVAEAWASGHSAESRAEAIAELQDKLAEQ